MGFLDNFKIKTKYGALAVTATPIIIIGGIYMAWAYARKALTREPDPPRKPVLTRSVSFGVLHGGKLALERMVHYHQARVYETSLNSAETELENQLKEERPDFKNLQVTIAKFEMGGREAKAVEILRNALKKKNPHEAYEIEMLLVEMLIYKGDFEDADKCPCLEDAQITDARSPLYKAIIHVMLDKPDAPTFWEKFNDIRTDFQWPPGLLDKDIYEVIDNFQNFKNFVNSLKLDIKAAKQSMTE